MSQFEIYELNGHNIKILYPSEHNQYYVLVALSKYKYTWIDKLNMQCVLNNMSKNDLIKKLKKYLEKEPVYKEIKQEIKEQKKEDIIVIKSKLQKLIETSISPLITEKTSSCLFDKQTVGNIIINEFLLCYEYLQKKDINLNLIDSNIYTWKLDLDNFKNKNLQKAEIEFIFHSEYYPNYPPLIKITNPKLKKSLNYRISNSKMTQLNYWTPTRDMKFIIERVINILEKYGELDITEKYQVTKNMIEIENLLIKFASFIDAVSEIDEIDEDYNFINFAQKKQDTNQNKTSNEYWGKGIGFGHSGASTWNIKEYEKNVKEKEEKICSVIQTIINVLDKDFETEENKKIIEYIEKSLIIPHLKAQFKQITALDIHKNENLFKMYLSLITCLANEKSMHLFNSKTENNETLYEIMEMKKEEFEKVLIFDKDKDNAIITDYINTFNILINPFFDNYSKEKKEKNNIATKQNPEIKKDIQTLYKEKMIEFRFKTTKILNTNYNQEYKKLYNSQTSSSWKKCQKRLATELSALMPKNHLPTEFDSSIFLAVDENNPMIIRALITGPKDTPYDSGCLIFDIYIPNDYPCDNPKVWFMNHGDNRFNPNLYNCGKVCLSILGTWKGDQSEIWNPDTSTLLQILVSIQAQILIEQPYFNEPGYESSINTEDGKNKSKSYNDNIRLYVMKSAVRDLLKNPKSYCQFEDVIINHFKLKKDYILNTYKKWRDEAPSNLKKDYENVYNEIASMI